MPVDLVRQKPLVSRPVNHGRGVVGRSQSATKQTGGAVVQQDIVELATQSLCVRLLLRASSIPASLASSSMLQENDACARLGDSTEALKAPVVSAAAELFAGVWTVAPVVKTV